MSIDLRTDLHTDIVGRKASADIIEQRIDVIVELMYQGRPTGQIVALCTEAWGIRMRAIKEYIRRGKIKIKEDRLQDLPRTLEEHLLMRDSLYREALKEKDHSTCLRILDSAAKLDGLVLDKKEVTGEVNHNVTQTLAMPPEWVAEQKAKIEAARQQDQRQLPSADKPVDAEVVED